MNARDAEAHFVYRYYDAEDRLLYVGCTRHPYLRRNAHSKSSSWFASVARVRHTVHPDKRTALARELEAIRAEKPMHNLKGRWDNSPRDHWEIEDYHSFLWALVESVDPNAGAVSPKFRQTLNAVIDEARERFNVTLLRRAA